MNDMDGFLGRMVFKIFFWPQFYYGTEHLYNYLMDCKNCLSLAHFNYVLTYFMTNAYWWHPENVLVCTISSPSSPPNLRQEALEKLLDAYPRFENNDGVIRVPAIRYFKKPTLAQIDVNAPDFFNILRWDELPPEYVTFTPILKLFTIPQIRQCVTDMNFHKLLPQLVCHTQRCEEWVHKTSDAVTKNQGHEKQLGNMVAAGESRMQNPLKKMKKIDHVLRD